MVQVFRNGVKRFQDVKNPGVWFHRLFKLVKTCNLCRPDLATEPLMNVLVTDCNNDVPVKTAPKTKRRQPRNPDRSC